MKKLFLILILTLSFQSLTKADDIREFEIEGMSVGDSLLDFFTKKEILKSPKANRYKENTYTTVTFNQIKNNNLSSYNQITLSYKSKDNRYIVVGIGGVLDFRDNHLKCYEKQDEIIKEIKVLFPNNDIIDYTKKISGSTDGSETRQTYIELVSGFIGVQCKKFGEDLKKIYNERDHLKVDIFTKEFNYWLVNIAFK